MTTATTRKPSLLRRFKNRYKGLSKGDTVVQIIIELVIILIAFVLLYPFLYMVSVSVSDYDKVAQVVLLPKGINFGAYLAIFRMQTVLRGYLNSVVYTVLGLGVSLLLTILCAYPLSKSWLVGKKVLTIFVLITMYFGGGMIPCYLLVTQVLHMKNTIFAIILPGAMNTYYMILMRTYFVSSIPKELEESAKLDGSSEMQTLLLIFLPLSKPIIATVSLYFIVISWNSWFGPSIYLDEKEMYPIQLILRNALSTNNIWVGGNSSGNINYKSMDYALTIAVVLPIIFTYPFCQKYFIKGVMAGSLKG